VNKLKRIIQGGSLNLNACLRVNPGPSKMSETICKKAFLINPPPFVKPKGSLIHVHKSPSLDPTLNLMNPVHSLTSYFLRSSLILLSHPRYPKCFFSFRFKGKFYKKYLSFSMHVTCLVHLIFLDLIILTTYGEEYKFLRFGNEGISIMFTAVNK